MSIQTALRCDRCKVSIVPNPEKLPKGWISGRDDSLKDDSLHTCPECTAIMGKLNDFLEWLPGELCRLVKEDGHIQSAFYDLAMEDLWDKWEEGR